MINNKLKKTNTKFSNYLKKSKSTKITFPDLMKNVVYLVLAAQKMLPP